MGQGRLYLSEKEKEEKLTRESIHAILILELYLCMTLVVLKVKYEVMVWH